MCIRIFYFIFVYVSCIYDNDIRKYVIRIMISYIYIYIYVVYDRIHDYSSNCH